MVALILSSLFCEILLTLRLSLPGLKALMVTFATPVESLNLGLDSSARLGRPKIEKGFCDSSPFASTSLMVTVPVSPTFNESESGSKINLYFSFESSGLF